MRLSGCDLARLERSTVQSGSSAVIGRFSLSTSKLTLLAEPENNWSARVAFVMDPALQMPFQGVLGTDGFLDKFAVTSNKYYDYFILSGPMTSTIAWGSTLCTMRRRVLAKAGAATAAEVARN